MISISAIFGATLGIVQGFLCYPSIIWAKLLAEKTLRPWKDDLLPISKDICLMIVLIFFATAHFAIALNIQRIMPSAKEFGGAWAVGLFLGLCFYVLVPIMEKKLKRDRNFKP